MAIRKKLNYTMNLDLYERAKKKADEMGISFAGLIAVSLSEYLKQDAVVDMMTIFNDEREKLKGGKK